MNRILIAVTAALLMTTAAHAKEKVLGQLPTEYRGEWCAVNGEDQNSDYMRGPCHRHNRPAVDSVRVNPDGIDFHEVGCTIKYAFKAPGGHLASFKCQQGEEDPRELRSFWIGLRGGNLFLHPDTRDEGAADVSLSRISRAAA